MTSFPNCDLSVTGVQTPEASQSATAGMGAPGDGIPSLRHTRSLPDESFSTYALTPLIEIFFSSVNDHRPASDPED